LPNDCTEFQDLATAEQDEKNETKRDMPCAPDSSEAIAYDDGYAYSCKSYLNTVISCIYTCLLAENALSCHLRRHA